MQLKLEFVSIYFRRCGPEHENALSPNLVRFITDHALLVLWLYAAAVDQVVDCLDEADCLSQPSNVDSSVVGRLLNDDRLLSILEVWLLTDRITENWFVCFRCT